MSSKEIQNNSMGEAAALREWLEQLDAFMRLLPHTQDKAEARCMIQAALSAPAPNECYNDQKEKYKT